MMSIFRKPTTTIIFNHFFRKNLSSLLELDNRHEIVYNIEEGMLYIIMNDQYTLSGLMCAGTKNRSGGG